MLKHRYIILISTLFLAQCTNDFKLTSATEILTSNYWEITTFIDNLSNESLDIPDSYYEFADSSIFVVYPENQKPQYSTWEVMDDDSYLRIGSNIYKIRTLTKKVMALEFGTIDIFYVPYKIN